MPEIPARLKRNGRDPDTNFEPSEELYRRVRPADFEEGQPLSPAFPLPTFSVNRQKFSWAEDVILGYPTYGILAFPVNGVPTECTAADGRAFGFRVEHVPEEDNYAHSEVGTYAGGEKVVRDPPKSVKTVFREKLFASCKIVRLPEANLL